MIRKILRLFHINPREREGAGGKGEGQRENRSEANRNSIQFPFVAIVKIDFKTIENASTSNVERNHFIINFSGTISFLLHLCAVKILMFLFSIEPTSSVTFHSVKLCVSMCGVRYINVCVPVFELLIEIVSVFQWVLVCAWVAHSIEQKFCIVQFYCCLICSHDKMGTLLTSHWFANELYLFRRQCKEQRKTICIWMWMWLW